MPANSLLLAVFLYLLVFFSHLQKSLSLRSSAECAHILTSTGVKRWPLVGECVCYSYIKFLYITVTGPITVIIIITIITIWKAGGHTGEREERRVEGRGEPRKRDGRMKDKRAKGKRKGQCFPSTPVHDFISFSSDKTFPGSRIHQKKCEIKTWSKTHTKKEDVLENYIVRSH